MDSEDKLEQNKKDVFISPIKSTNDNDSFLEKKISKISKKSTNNNLSLNLAPINLKVEEHNNNYMIKSKSSNPKDMPIKLPLISSNNDNSYYKMRQYKVSLPRHRDKKEISPEEDEKKVRSFLNKYAKSDYKGNKFLSADEIKKYDFDTYLKLQSNASIKFKPRYGDTSNELVNYINKVSVIRKQVMNDIMNEIEKKTENRYNNEKPKDDFKFRSKEKLLIDNRWKNTYSLDEYQKYFIKKLKGKISSMNYRQMLKKFHEISLICFSEGHLSTSALKRLNQLE